jgi:dolichol kinase
MVPSDAVQIGLWLAILAGGLLVCVALKRAGLATTYVRDLLHVGAGVWAFGLRLWRASWAPIGITVFAVVTLAAVPRLASRVRGLARFRDAVSDGDERFSGLVLYALAFAIFTAVARFDRAFPAAAALLALALGDGLGGLVGRHLGRLRYRIPWAKPKTLEGSLGVALFAGLAVLALAWWHREALATSTLVAAAMFAALVEAAAPRASDNVLLPAAVWAVLRVASR